ncbi:MBL fold hydrolase [Rhodobacter veldkampii DSM 11550]|uniref:MBL fold hydrolase n=1 Tax=Phaeovulum veldkampii DSM 11550 TaxID=1185920 RepID=A0A2T4JKX6_9RHOB|nr:ribonuclease J [Phaeovulum veldkampii]MBK5947381.1 MBL fold hydrolase [Phaeovulum veldkampii DSM 11550]PTE18556.1 MBL fold hydrolase [Phaeovulum veldkampii DSM 11550]TDQ59154.1 ribonuclease J [Phaeovulum veldkampii DSM 11550]
MKKDRLIYLPLGGAGEIGMNAYVYGYGPAGKERLILVDLGVTFPDMDTSPGVDLILPDISWLEENADRLEAIFITHAHEDHVGALAHLWPGLKVPVHARRFTARIAEMKMDEAGLPTDVIHVHAPRHPIEAGPFRVQFVPVSHSIPESSALVIDTPAGRIVHSGDFKLDGNPVVGEAFDPVMWHEIAREGQGVRILACDSTNIFSTHPGRSEATLAGPLTEFIAAQDGMVVATTFASNVARLKTLAEAGRAAGRSICMLGRAMKKMITAAAETGVLTEFPGVVSPEEAQHIPRENLMLIVTGSQGERRAASAQLSRGKYLGLEMREGDTFLFSSKTIPGNERGVIRIMNAMSEMGVEVVDDRGGLYHVSGHANRPDLEAVHDLLSPAILIPMHGEHRHLREHARLAQSKGIASEVVTNGMMIDLTGPAPKVVEHIEAGRRYLDGNVLIGALDGIVRDRIRMALNGHVLITVIVDEDDLPLGDAWVELMGLAGRGRSGAALADQLEAELAEFLERASAKVIASDDKIDEAIRRIVRQVCMEEIGKKPEVTVVVSRLVAE